MSVWTSNFYLGLIVAFNHPSSYSTIYVLRMHHRLTTSRRNAPTIIVHESIRDGWCSSDAVNECVHCSCYTHN